MDAAELFEEAITWLRHHYTDVAFYTERDIVWTLQTYLARQIAGRQLPYRVFNDYPMLAGPRRAFSADLVLLDQAGRAHLAAEFKYEPAHIRTSQRGGDIWRTKFGPTDGFWGMDGVAKDVQRVHDFVTQAKATVAYAIFIDEGSYFRHRPPHQGSAWIDWGPCGNPHLNVSLLWTRVPANPPLPATAKET
jgi:hypothetical protein